MYAIGTPGQAPRVLIQHEGFGDYDVREGEVMLDGAEPGQWVISEDGTKLLPYEPDAAARRVIQLRRLKRCRELAMALGCWTPKGQMDTDDASQAMLNLHAGRAATDPDYEVHWTMADNRDVIHTAADLIAAQHAMVDYLAAVHTHYRAARARLEAGEEIDVTQDWPEPNEPIHLQAA